MKMLPVGLTLERLRVRPVPRGELGMRCKELRGFHLGFLDAAKLREAGGQDTLRPRAVR